MSVDLPRLMHMVYGVRQFEGTTCLTEFASGTVLVGVVGIGNITPSLDVDGTT